MPINMRQLELVIGNRFNNTDSSTQPAIHAKM